MLVLEVLISVLAALSLVHIIATLFLDLDNLHSGGRNNRLDNRFDGDVVLDDIFQILSNGYVLEVAVKLDKSDAIATLFWRYNIRFKRVESMLIQICIQTSLPTRKLFVKAYAL